MNRTFESECICIELASRYPLLHVIISLLYAADDRIKAIISLLYATGDRICVFNSMSGTSLFDILIIHDSEFLFFRAVLRIDPLGSLFTACGGCYISSCHPSSDVVDKSCKASVLGHLISCHIAAIAW